MILIAAAATLFAAIIASCTAIVLFRRKAIGDAAVIFRDAINTATAGMPGVGSYWDGLAVERMPEFLTNVRVAVGNFSPHLRGERRRSFQRQWHELERHCKDEIPQALSPAERIYNNARTQAAKASFHNHVRKLLAFANKQA